MAKTNENKDDNIPDNRVNDLLEGINTVKTLKPKPKKSEALSQAEIDQLLMAISSGGEDEDDYEPTTRSRRIKIYDFKRPDVFSREQLRTISNGFELVARDWTVLLSAITKSKCHVHVASVDQLTLEECIRATPTPTAIQEFVVDRGFNNGFLQIDPSITFYPASKIGIEYPEHWLYDTVEDTVKENKNRELQDFECAVIQEKIFQPMLEVWKKTLTNYFLIENPEILVSKDKALETNPQFYTVMKPTDMCCLVTLECVYTADDQKYEGMINVCLSRKLVEHLINSYNEVVPDEIGPFNFGKIMETKVPIEVLLGGTSMSLNDIKGFGEGTIIELDKFAGEPVDIRVNGEILAKGEVVVIDENFGVRIVDMV